MTTLFSAARLVLAAAIAISCANCAAAADKAFPMSSNAASTTEPAQQYSVGQDWLEQRYRQIDHDLHGGVDLPKVRLVFVGDSITQMWQGWGGLAETPLWPQTFGQPGSANYGLNLGVAGDRTENVLLRLLSAKDGGFGHLDDPRIQPEIILFMCGVNNVGHVDEPAVDKIVAGDLAVIKRLRELRPHARILVQSILPTNHDGDAEHFIEPINAKLASAIGQLGPDVSWLDLYPSFLGADGKQDPTLFRDGYHPTIKGYQVWKARLLPVLDDIRKRRAAKPAGDFRSRIINAPTAYKAWGGEVDWRADKGVPGGAALRIAVAGTEKNQYDVGVYSAIDKPVKAGDQLVLAFWARLESAQDDAGAVVLPYNAIQLSTPPFGAVVQGEVKVTPKWELHRIAGRADQDYAAGALAVGIQLATGKKVVDVGPVFVYDLGQP